LQVSVFNTPAISVYLSLGIPRDRIAAVMTTVFLRPLFARADRLQRALRLARPTPADERALLGLLRLLLPGDGLHRLPPGQRDARFTTPSIRYRDLMSFPAYRVMLALFMVVTAIIFIPWTFTALYAREAAHVDNFWIGVLMSVLYLGSVFMGLSLGRLRRTLGSVTIVLCFEAAYVVSAILLLSSMALPILGLAFFLRGAFWSFRQVMNRRDRRSAAGLCDGQGYGLFALVTGAVVIVAYPIAGWMYGLQVSMPFWSSALLMAIAMLVTVWVRAYFHANYLKPPQVEIAPDDALPRAA